ncbi:MAG: succinylglutamate desuccinylase [Candidatus Melainabacteria bacterium HGW-Melainabacteria-1]|nr:MAG: succinylglutamate desuccinylase [Candidatus Melainabacteria bacterium HGW-Melainabacteria-1]
MKKHHITAAIFLILALGAALVAGSSFLSMRKAEPIVRGPGVSDFKMLSTWFPDLKGTAGDTEVYILKPAGVPENQAVEGASMLILGGTHPNEPSGFMSAVLLIENAVMNAGTLYVIPRANNSAFSHNDPQEGSPQRYRIKTAFGTRTFRYGSRATNPIHQWPDPDVYIHASSGQSLSGNETRNLNRGYPGRPDGTLTEKICYGITELIKKEKITITVDLHEASPEYPVNMAMVAHPNAMGLASETVIGLEMQDIRIRLEPSPINLRGLTHRELGDFTDTLPILMETPNASQGRLRGRTDEALVLTGIDPWYVKAQKLGRLYVPYDEKGHPLEERVGRHLAGIAELAFSWTLNNDDKPLEFIGIPSFAELQASGLGAWLKPVD